VGLARAGPEGHNLKTRINRNVSPIGFQKGVLIGTMGDIRMRPPRTPLTSPTVTFFYRRVFPFGWYGMLAAVFLVGLFNAMKTGGISDLFFLAVPLFMGLVSYRFVRKDEPGRRGIRCWGRAPRAPGQPGRAHRVGRHKERQLHSLYESAAGHSNTAAAEWIWRHNLIFYAAEDRAAGF